MFVADAVAMPVHWYYDVAHIKEDFNGWITKYEAPKDVHPEVKALGRPGPGTMRHHVFYIVATIESKNC